MAKENNVKVEVAQADPYGPEAMAKLVKHVGPWASTILFQVISGKNAFTGEPIDAMDTLKSALLDKISNHGYQG